MAHLLVYRDRTGKIVESEFDDVTPGALLRKAMTEEAIAGSDKIKTGEIIRLSAGNPLTWHTQRYTKPGEIDADKLAAVRAAAEKRGNSEQGPDKRLESQGAGSLGNQDPVGNTDEETVKPAVIPTPVAAVQPAPKAKAKPKAKATSAKPKAKAKAKSKA